MRRAVTVRVPRSWEERLNSERVTRWLEDFCSAPYSLPDDPGAGEVRVCLSLPASLVKQLERKARSTAATALRRLAKAHSRELLSGDALQMTFLRAPEPAEHFFRPGKRKDSDFPAPWRHLDGLVYSEELAISPVEQDRRYRLVRKRMSDRSRMPGSTPRLWK